MNLLNHLTTGVIDFVIPDRDTRRARQDASARLAPLAIKAPSMREIVQAETTATRLNAWFKEQRPVGDPGDEQPVTVTVREHLEASRPMVIDFTSARANRPDYGPSVAETLEMIETVARYTYEGTTGKSWTNQKETTFPMRKKVRESVRAGLEAAGLVR